jgi:glycosyltransferase involved in cell wall biosynthesis
MHTLLTPDRGGVDVQVLLSAYRIPSTNVYVSDQYQYIQGYPTSYMATMYNSADVLLMPSAGEGFGCPAIEAQLCGCPVILTDWAGSREMCFLGTKIPTTDAVTPISTGQKEWMPMGGWHFRPNATAIYEALEVAHEHRASEEERAIGRQYAMRYEIGHVVTTYWKPALQKLEKMLVQGDIDGLV